MPNKTPSSLASRLASLPEVFESTSDISRQVSKLTQAGLLRKIGLSIYTRNTTSPIEVVVRTNLWQIVSMLVPGCVISYRTAFESAPAEDGSVFVSGPYERTMRLPGLVVRQVAGPGPLMGDVGFIGELRLASRPRAFLENLRPSRARKGVSRSVGRRVVEGRLAEILRINDEPVLGSILEQAHRLAPFLGLEREFRELDALVQALLKTRSADLSSPAAIARTRGEPYDPARLPVLDALRSALDSRVFPFRPDDPSRREVFQNVAFLDAYFSSFIEGIEWEIGDAQQIVFNGRIPEARRQDANDLLGLFRVVGNQTEMGQTPQSFTEFLEILRRRHAVIMEARSDMRPGEFKEKVNRAGSTVFVAPDMVRGTLRQGFDMYNSLSHPFARAAFIMFLVAEVHPFPDGNGRVARAMLNSELVSAGQKRILVPSVFRNKYVANLKLLTKNGDPSAFIAAMTRLQGFVASIDMEELEKAKATLMVCNAFEKPSDIIKLRLTPVESDGSWKYS